jgi:trimeric autotransporter adhesin
MKSTSFRPCFALFVFILGGHLSAVLAAPKLEILSQGQAILTGGENRVLAWGENTYGQTMVPTGLTGVIAIAAGADHTLALKQDGSVVAWGDGRWGQTTVPTGLTGVTAIAAGQNHSVALKQDGTVVTWGGLGTLPAIPAGLTGVVAVAAGSGYTVALKQDGTVVAWGDSFYGGANVPTGLTGVVAIAVGAGHTLALKQDGSVVAWGYNDQRQSTIPQGLSGVRAISAGEYISVALQQDGRAVIWGAVNSQMATIRTAATAITAGSSETVGLNPDGTVVALDHEEVIRSGGYSGLRAVAIDLGESHSVAIGKLWSTIQFNSVVQGATRERSLTLTSRGLSDVEGLSAQIVGLNADQYTITSAPLPSTLSPGMSHTLTIRYTGRGQGLKGATLRVTSNDPDVGTYQVALRATALAPEITVEDSRYDNILDGGLFAMNTSLVGTPVFRFITIRNTGTTTLSGLSITKDGPGAGHFGFTQLTGTIAAGSIQKVLITFAPTAPGLHTATLRIASNDADENPFDIVLTGSGSSMDLMHAGKRLGYFNEQIELGELNSQNIVERSFTLTNRGPTALTGLNVAWSGADPEQFAITPGLPERLEPGATFTFTVKFTAERTGTNRLTTMRLISDGVGEPVLSVRFNAAAIRGAKLWVEGFVKGLPEVLGTRNRVVAWGDNGRSQTNVPQSLMGITAVAAGGEHTLALLNNGRIEAWGDNRKGQSDVPTLARRDVVAMAAGAQHSVALKMDGKVVAWGSNDHGQTAVPANLGAVVAIAAGGSHTLALKANGSVIAWGGGASGQTSIPLGLGGVVAIAAGGTHTVALQSDGKVIAWGGNDRGQSQVPAGLSGVTAIAAGSFHTVALKQDGSVVTWGDHRAGSAPTGLGGVVAIDAGGNHTTAIKQDGSMIAWGNNSWNQIRIPQELGTALAVGAGDGHTVALVDHIPLYFGRWRLGETSTYPLTITNPGTVPLTIDNVVIEGPDRDVFQITVPAPNLLIPGSTGPLSIGFTPRRPGPAKATLVITSNDPDSPAFRLDLRGSGIYEIRATKSRTSGSPFVYNPVQVDRQTGLMLQKLRFTNTTGTTLPGLRLYLFDFHQGVQVYGATPWPELGAAQLIYSKPIATNETVAFDLVHFDPKRRLTTPINQAIYAEGLLYPEPDSTPVEGTLVPLRSVRASPPGPLLEWDALPAREYVVEYSDDGGTTWFSAVHRLSTLRSRFFWVDRGQPETKSKPVPGNLPQSRRYRLKQR